MSDEALRKAYDEERDRFPDHRAAARAAQISVAVDKGDEDAARAKAAAIAERARKGEDFAKLAAEVSDDAGTKAQGGDLGWMTPRDAPFENALFGMQVGAISDPVRSDFGFHVIKLDELKPATVRPFEEVRDEVLPPTCAHVRPSRSSTIARTSSPTACSTRTTSSRRSRVTSSSR